MEDRNGIRQLLAYSKLPKSNLQSCILHHRKNSSFFPTAIQSIRATCFMAKLLPMLLLMFLSPYTPSLYRFSISPLSNTTSSPHPFPFSPFLNTVVFLMWPFYHVLSSRAFTPSPQPIQRQETLDPSCPACFSSLCPYVFPLSIKHPTQPFLSSIPNNFIYLPISCAPNPSTEPQTFSHTCPVPHTCNSITHRASLSSCTALFYSL